ncbi:MAG: FHA domain-containing protein [Acidimicrobiia bacterium]|nr:FHA domain-containing protein [Acidimicrobiia bacterium]
MDADEPIRDHDPTIAYQPELMDQDQQPRVAGAFTFALVIERGPRAGLAYILAPGKTTIGRSTEANIFLDDVTVSRQHASVIADGGSLVVEDDGSLNGTYVNGERVDRSDIKPGDELIVGKYHLVVAAGDG